MKNRKREKFADDRCKSNPTSAHTAFEPGELTEENNGEVHK